MNANNVAIAEALYTSIGKKDVKSIEKFIHPQIQFTSPFAKINGKEEYLEAVKRFTTIFNTLIIRAKFGKEDQVMIVYDVDCPKPVGNVPSAVLIDFHVELITKIELFFDTGPFALKKS